MNTHTMLINVVADNEGLSTASELYEKADKYFCAKADGIPFYFAKIADGYIFNWSNESDVSPTISGIVECIVTAFAELHDITTRLEYTRDYLEQLTESQLDEIYTELVGYPVIAESEGLETKESAIDLILQHYNEIEKHKPAPVQPSHTPGPWKVKKVGNAELIGIDSSMGFITIAEVPITQNTNMPQYTAIDKANARLISLAPEMLEALNESLTVICELQDMLGSTPLTDKQHELTSEINSLLSRARQ